MKTCFKFCVLLLLCLPVLSPISCDLDGSSAPAPQPDGGGGGSESDESSTYIRFNNPGHEPVDVYVNSNFSGTPVASVEAFGQSGQIKWTSGGHSFYLKYNLDISGVEIGYTGTKAYIYRRVDKDKINEITIEPLLNLLTEAELDESLSSDVYVKITNNSYASLTFHRGSATLTPVNMASGIINNGESAVYHVIAGASSNYSFYKNNVVPISFPAQAAAFQPGMVYCFVYDGDTLRQDPPEAATISVKTAYEALADKPVSAAVPVPAMSGAEALSDSRIQVNWSAVGGGAYSYYVYKSTSADGAYTLAGIVKGTSFESGGLNSLTRYYYKVRAALNGELSAYSSEASAQTKLAAPSGVTAETLSFSSIRVSWNAVPKAASYYVFRAASEDGEYAEITNTSDTSYMDSGLNVNAVYYYKVRAYSNGGDSLYSDVVYAATTDLQPPSGLSANAVSSTQINLSWNASAGATSYYIYRSLMPDGTFARTFALVGNVAAASYSDSDLEGGTTYYYKIRSYYNGLYSNYSSAVSAATPVNTPTGVSATALSASEIQISWDAVGTGADYYYVYTASNSGGLWTELGSVSGTSYNHNGLSPDLRYYYKVKAFRNGIYSADSDIASVIPLEAGGLFVENNNNHEFVPGAAHPFSIANALNWLKTNAQDNTSYIIIISANETLAPQTLNSGNLNNKTNVSITLKGYDSERTVQLASAGSMFKVGSSTTDNSVTLILDENITLRGISYNNASLIYSYGTLIMSGGKVSGNTNSSSSSYGGGVNVNSGSFTMNGGEISGNTAHSGGGVNVNSGSFTINGGKISGNTATNDDGGGVYVSSGIFTMNGGEILENTVPYYYLCGGVGEISGNTATFGGGVNVNSGSFTMNGGEISGNTASSSSYSYGGGVYIHGGTFTMSSGEISNNTASPSTYSYGGGVYINSGIFTMSGGEISGNTSSAYSYSYGGGVHIGGGTFKKQPDMGSSTSGVIKNNATGYANGAKTGGNNVYGSSTKKRETTIGETQSLDSTVDGAAGGWVE